MVSALTLSFLLTGTVYPNSSTRFGSESLGMLTAGERFYRSGHQPQTSHHDDDADLDLDLDDAGPVSHTAPDRVFARISRRSGEITIAPRGIGRPSSRGPATVVDHTVRRRCALYFFFFFGRRSCRKRCDCFCFVVVRQ